jgi:glyoxylase-like metal-dependent hydrolase (beta-lactamase superfamily II)
MRMNVMNRRTTVLAAIVLLGTLSIVVSARQAPPQGPTKTSLDATNIVKVRENLYVITGSSIADMNAFSGGNTAVLITDAGVVLVDTKLPGWGKPIIDRIKAVTDKPITTIINTHTHNDHTGSNEFFGASVETIVHENTRTNMMKMDAFKGEKAKFLPKKTYRDTLSLGRGKDQIDLYYLGVGHTNGDTFVVFPALRVMHAGDMFAWKALPYIDTSNGGSVVSHAETLRKAVSTIENVDTVITGHTPVLTWNELSEYADFNNDFVSWAREQIKAGKTVGDAAAAYQVPAKYTGYSISPNSQGDAKANVEIVYKELKK